MTLPIVAPPRRRVHVSFGTLANLRISTTVQTAENTRYNTSTGRKRFVSRVPPRPASDVSSKTARRSSTVAHAKTSKALAQWNAGQANDALASLRPLIDATPID